MHVIAGGLEIAVAAAIHWQRFVTTRKEVAKLLVLTVKAIGIDTQQPMHPLDQVAARRFSDKMKVVAHQAPGMDLPVGFLTGFTKGVQEQPPILVIQENGLAPVATIHRVINRPGVLNSELPCHLVAG